MPPSAAAAAAASMGLPGIPGLTMPPTSMSGSNASEMMARERERLQKLGECDQPILIIPWIFNMILYNVDTNICKITFVILISI